MMATCAFAGVLAFPICLYHERQSATIRVSPVDVIWMHGSTAIFAVLTALVISALHLSGH